MIIQLHKHRENDNTDHVVYDHIDKLVLWCTRRIAKDIASQFQHTTNFHSLSHSVKNYDHRKRAPLIEIKLQSYVDSYFKQYNNQTMFTSQQYQIDVYVTRFANFIVQWRIKGIDMFDTHYLIPSSENVVK